MITLSPRRCPWLRWPRPASDSEPADPHTPPRTTGLTPSGGARAGPVVELAGDPLRDRAEDGRVGAAQLGEPTVALQDMPAEIGRVQRLGRDRDLLAQPLRAPGPQGEEGIEPSGAEQAVEHLGRPRDGQPPGRARLLEPAEQAHEATEEGAVEVLAGGEVDVEGRAARLVEDPECEGAHGRALAHRAPARHADAVAPAGAAEGEGGRGGHRSLLPARVDVPRSGPVRGRGRPP